MKIFNNNNPGSELPDSSYFDSKAEKMVTITSMKKIQSPDLLLDQPHHQNQIHPGRFSNNLNKKSRVSPRNSPKTRRLPAFHSPEELTSSSSISTTTTLTSSEESSSSNFEGRLHELPNQNQVVVDVDGSDEINNTRWPQCGQNSRRPLSHHHEHPHLNPQLNPSRVWIRTKTKGSSSASTSSSSRGPQDGWDWRLPSCLSCTNMNRKHLIVLLVVCLVVVACLVTLLAVLLRSSSQLTSSSNSNINTSGGDKHMETSLFTSSDINQVDDNNETPEGEEESEGDNYDYSETSSSYEHKTKPSNNNNNKNNLDLKEVSRISWNMLNNNQERASSSNSNNNGGNNRDSSNNNNNRNRNQSPHHPPSNKNSLIPSSFSSISGGEEVILPSKMIFRSNGGVVDNIKSANTGPNSSGENKDNKNKKRSCCRTQKYSQVIKRDGCEPLTITNRMCFGQCVSVWVPGLFASFPVCRPSRSGWKTVTLTCGKNRKRKVKIEKVRRCSCMEIEPTAPSPISKK